MYVCLDACKRGFLASCRPFIGIDGCHLKGTTGGQLLVAVGKDGNDNIVPIAYAMLKLRIKALRLGFYNVCWMTSDMWMRIDGSLPQTDRRQETINVHVNYLYFFKKYHDL